jgi:Domain of unknown function (DUF4326)
VEIPSMQPEHSQSGPPATRSLAQLEGVVERGLSTFVEVGRALEEIRTGRLYRDAGYSDFDTYCRERWGWSRARGDAFIRAAGVATELDEISANRPVLNAWQARALGRISDPDERAAVWREVTAPDAPPPTGRLIRQAIDQRQQRLEEWPPPEPLEPHAGWTAREVALWERLERGETVVVNFRADQNLIAAARDAGLFVRIDRESDWGNPFEMPGDGDRYTVVTNYRTHYLPFKPSLERRRGELRGKALGCWCAPDLCHGNVLKAWLEEEGVPR